IIKRNIEPGQFVNLNDAVMVMADHLIVQAQIDETDISRIKLNQAAAIQLDAFPNKTIPGAVEQIAYESVTINNVNVYNVNVLPKKVPSFFRSGMSATINFTMEEKKDALWLPSAVVKKMGPRAYCFVKKEGKLVPLQVKIGLEENDRLEIVSGLNEGDGVVIPTAKLAQDLLSTGGPRQPFNFLGGNRRRP
ncbi:HlyD family efflux transporter periplasmic adaptor subunit, partial [Candidatus Saganbacteria bacterium]|nr:HlyD family efflux transporter periplasmic adaptor subunit [Candidatus Saganbacteria bacterium]